MPQAPKHVLWTARHEADGTAFDFRLITPKDREFTLSRKEHTADHPDGASEDDLALAAYEALRGAIERRVDEIDGDPTTKAIKLGKKGQPTGVGDADGDPETIDTVKAERDAIQARYDELVGSLQRTVAEHAPAEVADGE